MDFPHVLLLPLPFQGHVIPLMAVAHHLLDAGFTVTFVNTEYNHHRLLAADTDAAFLSTKRLHLVGIPDGMSSDEERKDLGLICKLIPSGMTAGIKTVIQAAALEGRPVNWMVADQNMAWAFPLAKKLGLRTAAFWPASAAMIALLLTIPNMVQNGLIDEFGLPKTTEPLELSPGMPALHMKQLGWNMDGNSAAKSAVFPFILTNNIATVDHAELLLCNTVMDLELQALSLIPSATPIGPLFASKNQPAGHLHPPANSSTVISWLDVHPPTSVLYIAFGSHTIFGNAQIEEIAYGLEQTGRPFLWVARADSTTPSKENGFWSGFVNRVKGRGLLVGWAPQQRVLAHSSIGLFISHCGWNSTLEGVTNGLRFLCWPYFTDQFLNQGYLCDMWRIGLRMSEELGAKVGGCEVIFVSREQIKKRIEEVMMNEEMKDRALIWKEKATMLKGGSSFQNLRRVFSILKSV